MIAETAAWLVQPYIEELIALLLFVACLRIGPAQVIGAGKDLKASLLFTLVLQLALPLLIVLIAWWSNASHSFWFVLVLLTAAPPISGSPHLVYLLGHDPGPTLRQLVVGTALLPLTIIPVFYLLPEMGDLRQIVGTAGRLLLIIMGAALAAFAVRRLLLGQPTRKQILAIDGVATCLLAIVVLGLMTAIHAEIRDDWQNLLMTLGFAMGVNFGLQILVALLLSRTAASVFAVPMGLIAGNRNVALFLTALTIADLQPLLLFIACYQIPMYLTPLVMRQFYLSIPARTAND